MNFIDTINGLMEDGFWLSKLYGKDTIAAAFMISPGGKFRVILNPTGDDIEPAVYTIGAEAGFKTFRTFHEFIDYICAAEGTESDGYTAELEEAIKGEF